MKGVFMTALVFAAAQSLIYFLFSAGYSFSAFLVVEGRNTYEEIFRSAVTATNAAVTLGLSCVSWISFPTPVTCSIYSSY